MDDKRESQQYVSYIGGKVSFLFSKLRKGVI
jgi:hypothetical protein